MFELIFAHVCLIAVVYFFMAIEEKEAFTVDGKRVK